MDALVEFLLKHSTSAPSGSAFRVGIIIEGDSAAPWILECGREAATLPGVTVEWLLLPENAPPAEGALLRRLTAWSQRRYDPYHRIALTAASTKLSLDASGTLAAESLARIRELDFDLLFAPLAPGLRGDCSGLARFGVWSLAIDGRRLDARGYQFFWNSLEGRAFHTFSLVAHTTRFEAGTELCRYTSTTDPGLHFTQNHFALEAIPGLLCLHLLALLERGGTEECATIAVSEPAALPGNFTALRFVAAKCARSAWLRLPGQSPELEWFVGSQWRRTAIGAAGSFQGAVSNGIGEFSDVACFRAHEAADPFAVHVDGRYYMFFEDIVPPKRLGRLAALELSPDGQSSGPKVIVEHAYHLSYPLVFKHEGEWYMLPESAENRTVDLYRAEEFPYRWQHVQTLASGPQFVDTTPFHKDGVWYFFTTAILPGNAMVNLLFYSESLTGAWRSHPANPLSADAVASRGAGAIFRHNGRWLRPVQDCAVCYGYAVRFYEIEELTAERFREKPFAEMLPDWHRTISATHTWNSAGLLELRDGKRPRGRG